MPQTLYEQDFYAWSMQQAELFRAKKFAELDWENLSEEIEDMGKSEKRELFSRIKIILIHLLKWKYEPEYENKNSWLGSIKESRSELKDLLDDNPSLKNQINEAINKRYLSAVETASDETGKPQNSFPTACEWTAEQILDKNFFPN